MLALAAAGATPSVAHAEAGDYCVWFDLNPNHVCNSPEYWGGIIELESWNSDGKGLGSCAEINEHRACSPGLGSGYNET